MHPRIMFELNEPYEQSDPQTIRSDFAELSEELGVILLDRLACYISTDTLREFMNDLAMGRV